MSVNDIYLQLFFITIESETLLSNEFIQGVPLVSTKKN